MVRRFEMPKKVMNEIKKMDIPEQLEALDKYFNKIGMTQHLIDEMGGTTLGIWAQIKEKVAVILRDMGAPALLVIKNFITKIRDALGDSKLDGKMVFDPETGIKKIFKSDLTKFKEYGANIIKNIISGLTEGSVALYGWFNSIKNNEEFKKQTTLFGKVKWVIDDVYANFLSWLNSGGKEKISKVISDMIQILVAAIESSMEVIIPVATSLGTAIGVGIKNGFMEAMKGSWMVQAAVDKIGAARKKALSTVAKIVWNKSQGNKGQSKAGGLSRVPYNGFQATLHKNERVLTPEEAKAYNEGKGGNSYAFHVTMTGAGSTEKDADRLFEYFVRKVEAAGGAGA
jgi:hypothetical protein